MDRPVWFWRIAVAGWALVIFVLSSIPGASFPKSDLLSNDKLAHATVYAVLGAFVFLALRRSSAAKSGVVVLLAGAIATLYGCTDELHQLFVPGRAADWRDVVADAVGGFVGALSASVFFSGKARRGSIGEAEGPAANSHRAS
jgi:VanZ family protein